MLKQCQDSYHSTFGTYEDKKNALMDQGRYTDAVDEVILKMMKAKKKAFIVRTVS